MFTVTITGQIDDCDELLQFLGYEVVDEEPKPDDCNRCEAPPDKAYEGILAGGVAGGILDRRPFLARLRARVVDLAVARGADRAQAEQAVGEIGDHPFLEWLMNGGLEMIVKAVLAIIAALG